MTKSGLIGLCLKPNLVQQMKTHHCTKNNESKESLKTKKTMAVGFWDHKGIILVEFLECSTMINADAPTDFL